MARENDTVATVAVWCGWAGDPRAFLFQNKDVPGISLSAKLHSGTCLLMDQAGESPVVGSAAYEEASAQKRTRMRQEREDKQNSKRNPQQQLQPQQPSSPLPPSPPQQQSPQHQGPGRSSLDEEGE